MYVKQIGMEEALRLAGKGREIMVMVPGIEGREWVEEPYAGYIGRDAGRVYVLPEGTGG